MEIHGRRATRQDRTLPLVAPKTVVVTQISRAAHTRRPHAPSTSPGRVPPGEGDGRANVYFVRSGPGWVLIDTAWPRRGQLIKAAAESLFGPGTRPAAIVLSHIHRDHSGSALELALMWGLPVYVHPAELVLAPGGYLLEYGNPLDHWLIAPLLALMPRRTVTASLARNSLEGAARAFDPAAGAGRRQLVRVRDTRRSPLSALITGGPSPASRARRSAATCAGFDRERLRGIPARPAPLPGQLRHWPHKPEAQVRTGSRVPGPAWGPVKKVPPDGL